MPLSPLLLVGAAALALWLGKWLGRRAGIDAEPVLWRMLFVGLLGARLAFVWQWRSHYLPAPLSILDLRDGGWEAVAGFAAASLYGLAQWRQRPGLKKPLLAAGVLLIALWTAGEVALAAFAGASRKPMPALSLPAVEGGTVDLARFIGKPTVLNLWATWCPPCRREMPVLKQAQRAHPEVNIVFVNQGEAGEVVVRYLQREGLVLDNMLLDIRRATGAAYNEAALPTTLFLDAEGRLVSTRIGELSAATLAQRLSTLEAAAPR